MDLTLFAQWRLRLAAVESNAIGAESDIRLRILLILLLSRSTTDRKTLLSHFKLDRITMRAYINALIDETLITVSTSATDLRQKHYSLTQKGVMLMKTYRDQAIKITFVTGDDETSS
jgi:DNA-binding MarR family transcriptional regulator